jgi:hypothetical protein
MPTLCWSCCRWRGVRALLPLADVEGKTSLSVACSEGHVGVALELVKSGGHELLHHPDYNGTMCLPHRSEQGGAGGGSAGAGGAGRGCPAATRAPRRLHGVARCMPCKRPSHCDAALKSLRAAARHTGLHYAASGGHLRVVEELCRTAPPGLIVAVDDSGRTALNWARLAGHGQCAWRLPAPLARADG